MSERLAWTFPGGAHEQKVTSVTLVNNTEKTVDTVVPAGKRWILLAVRAVNGDDVQRTVNIYIYKEAAKTNLLRQIFNGAVGAGAAGQWPGMLDSVQYQYIWSLVVLEAANAISVVWAAGGASTGAVDADGLIIDYLEVDL